MRIPKVCKLTSEPGSAAAKNPWKSLEIVVGDERIDSDTEFVILASAGIWKAPYNQSASSYQLAVSVVFDSAFFCHSN